MFLDCYLVAVITLHSSTGMASYLVSVEVPPNANWINQNCHQCQLHLMFWHFH